MERFARRTFLGSLGGLVAFGVGGVASGRAPFGARSDALDFGRLEELATLLQWTPAGELQATLIAKLRAGLALEDLVAAAALANARACGGHDYTGYHCFMALLPAWEMAQELEGEERWLPVLKVVHRQATHLEQADARGDVLHALPDVAAVEASAATRDLRACFEALDLDGLERAFVGRADATAAGALSEVQGLLLESLDVHRVVLTRRAWDVLRFTGEEHAETLLRQSLRFFHDTEARRVSFGLEEPPLRSLLPELLEEHGLTVAERGTRRAATSLVEHVADRVFSASKADAAGTVATLLGEGVAHADVGQGLSLAANRLLLNDPGRHVAEPGKPEGSVHGDATGLHASDAANAWRNLAAVSGDRDSAANLIAGAYHTAGQSSHVGAAPFPYDDERGAVERLASEDLLAHLDEVVAAGDQPRAGAVAAVYAARDLPVEPLFAVLRAHSLDADGALHAEKYYRTAREDHANARPEHRSKHLIALARVCASQAGFEAPGLAAARAALEG